MKTINFFCCKLSARLELGTISDFFMLRRPASWKDYIILDHTSVETVLKYRCAGKQVYLFSFGCVTFVNFQQEEVYSFLRYIESVAGNVDYGMTSVYNESHLLEVDSGGYFKLWSTNGKPLLFDDTVIPLMAAVIAKSTELFRMETEVDRMLDEADRYIDFLKKGSLRAHNRKLAGMMAKIIRFEYDGIESIRIYDRLNPDADTADAREMYDRLAVYYELDDRFEIVNSKIGDLRGILEAYSLLSNSSIEGRLLALEIFLLALFPLSHLLKLF